MFFKGQINQHELSIYYLFIYLLTRTHASKITDYKIDKSHTQDKTD